MTKRLAAKREFSDRLAIHIGGRWRIKKSPLDHDILRQDKQGQPTALVVDDDVGL